MSSQLCSTILRSCTLCRSHPLPSIRLSNLFNSPLPSAISILRISPRSFAASSRSFASFAFKSRRNSIMPSRTTRTNKISSVRSSSTPSSSSFSRPTIRSIQSPFTHSVTSFDDDLDTIEFERQIAERPTGKERQHRTPLDDERNTPKKPPPAKHIAYTDRRNAPKRPHWLPKHVPYKMVAPSDDAKNGWSEVLQRYGVAMEVRHIPEHSSTHSNRKKHPQHSRRWADDAKRESQTTSSSSISGTRARRFAHAAKKRHRARNAAAKKAKQSRE